MDADLWIDRSFLYDIDHGAGDVPDSREIEKANAKTFWRQMDINAWYSASYTNIYATDGSYRFSAPTRG